MERNGINLFLRAQPRNDTAVLSDTIDRMQLKRSGTVIDVQPNRLNTNGSKRPQSAESLRTTAPPRSRTSPKRRRDVRTARAGRETTTGIAAIRHGARTRTGAAPR